VLNLHVEEIRIEEDKVTCAILKDSGDDPDITNGILIYATVKKAKHDSIEVKGGKGVGTVTKPGLLCKVGEAAINPVPLQMIKKQVEMIKEEFCYKGGLDVIISVPEGEEIAKKTFNPRLGIEGGISILGSTGIVEPMSEIALIETIKLEMNQQKELGVDSLLVCPGNYGENFVRNNLELRRHLVLCSNYIGETLDFAVELGFKELLLIGNAGKLIKLGAGIMNTHSKYADCRMELLGVHAAMLGADRNTVIEIMDCITTEDAIRVLDRAKIRDAVYSKIMDKIDFYLNYRVHNKLKIGAIVFSSSVGVLGKTKEADAILEKMKNEEESE
jgi:cobalt-precorrin-5B (C1)-methyltransferase